MMRAAPVLTVDLAEFDRNLARMRSRVAPSQFMLVVKDDAYGHGLDQIVRRSVAAGVEWFAGYDVRTALAVRAIAGETARVRIVALLADGDYREAVSAGIELGVGDTETLQSIAAVASPACPARVHLKVDTGLHRNGIRPEKWTDAVRLAVSLEAAGQVEVVGIWSHISEASDAHDDDARATFSAAIAAAADAGIQAPVHHLAASAAAYARPEFRFDLTRIGAFVYGIRSAGGPSDDRLGIRPIATLQAPVTEVAGSAVRIGIGALDGLPSTLAGKLTVRTPVGPRRLIEINSHTSLVEGWTGAAPGQFVAIWGGDAEASATDAAEAIDTIGEEIVTRLSPRVERRYVG